jgi:chromosome segregation ATPase
MTNCKPQQDKLQETKRWLQKIQEEHEQTKRSLAEQIVLRKYHEEYGDKLQSLATKTISTLQNTVQDNNGLFQKLGSCLCNFCINA